MIGNPRCAEPEKPPGTVRIVLVEDDPADVYLLEKALSARHIAYELTRFEDGEEAVKALGKQGGPVPDLILVDLNLPRKDGFDVLRSIRSRPALVGIPIGVFTSSEAPADRNRIKLMGAERYIRKPPTLPEFLLEVGDAIEQMLRDTRQPRDFDA
jgi:CheY-like chemotaxis protein